MPPLHAAVALREGDNAAGRIRGDLDLDMAWSLDELLDVDRAVLEGRGRLGLRELDLGLELGGVAHQAQSLAAPAGRGLDHDREAHGFGRLGETLGDGPVRARHDRDLGRACQRLGRGLMPQLADGFGWRADEDEPMVGAGLREIGVLGQESVAGVDGVGPGALGRGQQRLDIEVAGRRRSGTDADGLVGQARV